MRVGFLSVLLLAGSLGFAQGYSPGQTVPPLTFTKLLNSSSTATTNGLQAKLTVLDFFGTWCLPCIKALPALAKLQASHNDLAVVLVSVEKEATLRAFLTRHADLRLPILVDDDRSITQRFQPPSLPFTVVLNKDGKVLALTEAAAITNEDVLNWLAGEAGSSKAPGSSNPVGANDFSNMQTANKTVQLSQDFVYAAKTGTDAALLVSQLSNLDYRSLQASLPGDNEKKAFWINLYNGFTQYFLRKAPGKYKDRGTFFSAKQMVVAGKRFSLDDIEHGILRRSKIKWSLGYLNKFFPGRTEKELRVQSLDPRLHFALNCGAKSCPPIAFYTPEKIDQQLDVATRSYLGTEVEIKEDVAIVPAILSWFRHDFGGKSGIRKLLRENGYTAVSNATKIGFSHYNWDLYLENYRDL